MAKDRDVSNKTWVVLTAAAIGAAGAIVAAAINSNNSDRDGAPSTSTSQTTAGGATAGPASSSPPASIPSASTAPSSTAADPSLELIYPETMLNFELDPCGPEDDIDLDVPDFPHLESAAEVDFQNCVQSKTYIFGKNGAVISTAAPPDADYEQCMQAVREEPVSQRVGIEPGLVVCVVHFDEDGSMRVFRLVIQQVSGFRPTTIVLTAVGWQ